MSILVGNSCFYPKQAGVSSKEPPEIQKKEVGLTICGHPDRAGGGCGLSGTHTGVFPGDKTHGNRRTD